MLDTVELLDCNGNCTGNKCNLETAHYKGLWHQTSHIWFYDKTGRILLQKRSKDSKTYSGLLDISCAGHIPSDLNAKQTALKEIKEELGININENLLKEIGVIKNIKTIPEFNKKDCEFNHIFLCELDTLNKDYKMQKEEVDNLICKDLKEFELDICDPNKIKEYVNHGLDYYSQIICNIKKNISKNIN